MVPQEIAATELESPFHGAVLNSDDESDNEAAALQTYGLNGFGDGFEDDDDDDDPNPDLPPSDERLASAAAPAESPAGGGMEANTTAVVEHLEDGQGWWSRSPSATSPPNPIHEKSQQDPSNFETLPYDVIPEMETPSTSPSTDLTAIDARIALLQNLAFNC